MCWLNKAKKKKNKNKEREREREREREPGTLLLCYKKKVIRMRRDKSQVMNKVRGMWEGICVKWISKHFSLHIFLPILEDKKSGPKRENFLFYFSSSIKQWKTRFSILFSILLVFTPTKHTLRDYIRLSFLLWLLFLFSNNKMYADFIEKKMKSN